MNIAKKDEIKNAPFSVRLKHSSERKFVDLDKGDSHPPVWQKTSAC
jgi:hypothetical protein